LYLCHADAVGDKPGRYWDLNEARWVRHDETAPDDVEVPPQASAAEDGPVAAPQEADVRSR
jgi:hypothetical protein